MIHECVTDGCFVVKGNAFLCGNCTQQAPFSICVLENGAKCTCVYQCVSVCIYLLAIADHTHFFLMSAVHEDRVQL